MTPITEPEGEDVSEATWTDDEVKTLTGYLGDRTVAAIEPELTRLRVIEAAARAAITDETDATWNALRAALSEVPSDAPKGT